MFAKGYEVASAYTHPLVVFTRHWDATVTCGGGAFVIVNDEGWVVTAAHMIVSVLSFKQHESEIAAYKQEVVKIEGDARLTPKERRKRVNRLRVNSAWITNHSLWWGRGDVTVPDLHVMTDIDLAVGRLEPFSPEGIGAFPVFKNPSKLRPGTSLCKLGFPFHAMSADFNEETQTFHLAPGSLPVPRFPIEGIYSRNCLVGKTPDGKYEVKFLETSSPGLRGQSGGPLFDSEGRVWGIQSHTRHFPLGFNPRVRQGSREVEEHQFLNAGMAVHPEVLVAVLHDMGVKIAVSDD